MHWKTLDLDPAQATAKDVKRAYAQRLKKCRPDRDPEGFRLLHDSYQNALGELEWRAQRVAFRQASMALPDVGARDLAAPPQLVPGAAPGAQVQAAMADTGEPPEDMAAAISHIAFSPAAASMLEVLDRLEDALKNDLPDVAQRVREAEVALYENPDEVARWGHVVHNLILKYGTHPQLRLGPETLLFELEHQSMAATCAVIDRLAQGENSTGVNGLAELFVRHKQRINTPAGGSAASHLACVAATWAKDKVGPLADIAYENLARVDRDVHMRYIDQLVAKSALSDPCGPLPRRVERQQRNRPFAHAPRVFPWRIGILLIYPLLKILMLIASSGSPSYAPPNIIQTSPARVQRAGPEDISKSLILSKLAEKPEREDWKTYMERMDRMSRKDREFTPPGSTRDLDPSGNPYLKLLREPPAGGK